MAIYGDEEVVRLLNMHKKYTSGDVYSGIKIRGDLYNFHEYQFMDGMLKIMIPLRFIDMPEDMAKLKYGHMPKPDVLKSSRDCTIDIMITFTEEKLQNEDIEQTILEQICILKKIQPAYEIYEQKIEENGNVVIGWFDYKMGTMDIPVYCMNFILSINGKMVIGRFSCDIYKAEYWKSVFEKILYSINNEEHTLK